MNKFLAAALALALSASAAFAQWQVPAGNIPIGKGPGITGFDSVAPGAGKLLGGSPFTASANPVLGVAGSVLGGLYFSGDTSGQVFLRPNSVAGGSPLTVLLPSTAGTIPTNIATYETLAALTAATVPSGIKRVRINTYATAGDKGHGEYASMTCPASLAWQTTSADGACWTLDEPEARPEQFGAIADNSTDSVTGWNRFLSYVATVSHRGLVDGLFFVHTCPAALSNVTTTGMVLEGNGADSSMLRTDDASCDGILKIIATDNAHASFGVHVKGFTIQGGNVAGRGITVQNASSSSIEDMVVRQTQGHAIDLVAAPSGGDGASVTHFSLLRNRLSAGSSPASGAAGIHNNSGTTFILQGNYLGGAWPFGVDIGTEAARLDSNIYEGNVLGVRSSGSYLYASNEYFGSISGTYHYTLTSSNPSTIKMGRTTARANINDSAVTDGKYLNYELELQGYTLGATTSGTAGDCYKSSGTFGIAGTWGPCASATVANPTASVGLTAVNGTATSGIRSDGAPALSQSIAPTWTGTHIFSGTLQWTPTDATISADQNDYTLPGKIVSRINGGAADRNITGLAGGADGRIACIFNNSSTNSLILKNASASSTAANRFAISADVTIGVGESRCLAYSATDSRWEALVGPLLRNSGATAAAYGGQGKFASITVDAQGRITAASDGTLTTLNSVTYPASYTSGGIPYASGTGAISSSAALTANLPVIGGGAGAAPTVGTRSGNTTSFATTSGVLTSTHYAGFDASGNIVDNGAGSGGGSVTTTYPLSGTTALTFVGSLNQGRLTYVNTTTVKFAPFRGDLIKINGVVLQIPAAGIAGCANTSVFVNGTGSSNLGASSLYYVYAFVNSGTVTCDFRTGGHATSSTAGNIGTEILSGDDTRSLIGMVLTDASNLFQAVQVGVAPNYGVLSWFNRRDLDVESHATSNGTTTSASYAEMSTSLRASFLVWSDEGSVSCAFTGNMANNNSGAGHGWQAALRWNGSTLAEGYYRLIPANTSQAGVTLVSRTTLSEGGNTSTLMGLVDNGTDTLTLAANDGSDSAGHRSTISCTFRG